MKPVVGVEEVFLNTTCAMIFSPTLKSLGKMWTVGTVPFKKKRIPAMMKVSHERMTV